MATYVLEPGVIPEKKTHFTKETMPAYIVSHGTVEDMKWYKEQLKTNQKNKVDNRTNTTCVGYDWKPIRNAFIDRFYKEAYDEAKKQKNKKTTVSYIDNIDKLIAEMENQK